MSARGRPIKKHGYVTQVKGSANAIWGKTFDQSIENFQEEMEMNPDLESMVTEIRVYKLQLVATIPFNSEVREFKEIQFEAAE